MFDVMENNHYTITDMGQDLLPLNATYLNINIGNIVIWFAYVLLCLAVLSFVVLMVCLLRLSLSRQSSKLLQPKQQSQEELYSPYLPTSLIVH